jgi:erythromycin esterase-like protein
MLSNSVAALIRGTAHAMTGAPSDYDPLLERVGDARFVLLGEASHGTHEFYRQRAEITRQLIVDKQFTAVAVEADWPDAYRINRYVRGAGSDRTATAALDDFKRFPTWMWRNTDVVAFVEWLRDHNQRLGADRRIGFYGLDLYSLQASIDAVLQYLDRVDPAAAARARRRYGCFDHFGDDSQAYGYAAGLGLAGSCEDDVITQLRELQRRAGEYASRDGRVAADEFFFAEQNARLVRNAEEYYRSMFRGRALSWNLRDQHMAETLHALVDHLERQGPPPKVVVWEHNSHLGDARATAMSDSGEVNVGQLVRQLHGDEAVLVGWTTYEGTVTAASEWGGPAERKQVRPGLPGSYEALFHDVGVPRFLLRMDRGSEVAAALVTPRLERAIGVIYLPQTERASHYFHARLSEQFDAVLHVDRTRAVQPLDQEPLWAAEDTHDMPETYPSGL